MSPKVSVVMPTYNRAQLIAQAIQSVLDQTYQDFELVVVDDGSSDDTEAVVRGFEDSRIRYIYQANQGISTARNTGLRVAEGQYIAFLDSDDLWLPRLLELEVPILDSSPDIGLVYAKAQAIDLNGNAMAQIQGAFERFPGQTLKSALLGTFVCTITALVQGECFERVGVFDETIKAAEDWDMWVRMAKYYRFVHIDKVLARFRMHPGRYTGVRSGHCQEVSEGMTRVLDKAFSDGDLSEEVLAIKPLAYRNVYMDIGLRWLTVPAWRESAHYFWRAVVASPNRLTTPFRIVWLILFYNVFSKMVWSSRLISKLVDLRRRRRSRRPL